MGKWLTRPKAAVPLRALALALPLLPSAIAHAAPRRLDCNLTQVETVVGSDFNVQSENRSVAIVVDDQAKTIVVYQDGSERALGHVTITEIAMNGYADDMSLGLQMSSGSIALQSYGPDSTKSEFGICSQSPKPTP